jgi:hypothetical protein
MPPTRDSPRVIDAAAVRANPAARRVRKRPVLVSVEFTRSECIVRTREGDVAASPGDAIVTGTRGERWPVARARFNVKYEPVPPLRHGEPGLYRPRPLAVRALQVPVAFQVMLEGGHSQLEGAAGDWAVDYGDGSLGVVSSSIFAETYEDA